MPVAVALQLTDENLIARINRRFIAALVVTHFNDVFVAVRILSVGDGDFRSGFQLAVEIIPFRIGSQFEACRTCPESRDAWRESEAELQRTNSRKSGREVMPELVEND